jgi:chemotaxis protein methyltransferase CheR
MKETMSISQKDSYYKIKMTTEDFNRLSKYIYNELGIKMPIEKKLMLQSRLLKRLSELHIGNFKDYLDFVFSKEGKTAELKTLTDLVTTNKTDFFREPIHFTFLQDVVLPELVEKKKQKKIKFWSAGCSSGEEPYTLAMTLSDYLEGVSGYNYSIHATDLSTRMLEKASLAVYGLDRVKDIPLPIKRKYLLKSKDPQNKTVRIVPDLRKKITFQHLNFMDHSYYVDDDFDAIFCRNVIIYFDRATQEMVINKLTAHLKPGGYFFLGHSESITNMDIPLKHIKPTIFQKI